MLCASTGDFRTKASGNWNQFNTWQYYNGSSWVNATYTPTYTDGNIDILSGHIVSVTANVTTDLSIANQVYVYETLINKGTITSSAPELIFSNGSVYQHNRDGGAVPDATWNDGSTCEINGVYSSGSVTNTLTGSLSQVRNLTVINSRPFNLTLDTDLTVKGNLDIFSGAKFIIATGGEMEVDGEVMIR